MSGCVRIRVIPLLKIKIIFPIYFSSFKILLSRQLHQNPHGDHKQQGTNEVTPEGPHTPVD